MKRLRWIAFSVVLVGCERVVLFRKGQDASTDASDTRAADVVAPQDAQALNDASSEEAALLDAAAPDVRVVVDAPRPIAPLSAMQLDTNRPMFRWRLAPDSDGAELEVCSTRSCTNVEARATVAGTEHTLSTALSPGVHFWRLRGRRGASVGATYSPVWQFYASSSSGRTQAAWGPMPDFNGDGWLDFAVGDEHPMRGQVSVYFGSPSGVPPTPSVVFNPGDSNLGFEAASVGDVNGDGFGDLAVGAPNFAGTPGSNGTVLVYFGSARGLAAGMAQRLSGASFSSGFGAAITSIGDFDADGFGDVAIASIFRSAGGTVEVYRGSAGGLDSSSYQLLSGLDPGGEFGHDLSSADLDRDGVNELLVGVPRALSNRGRALLAMGSRSGFIEPLRELVPQSMSGTVTEPGQPGPLFGRSLRVVGDIDGDGFFEFVVNAPYDENGSVAVYRGADTVARDQRPTPRLVLRGDGASTGTGFGFSLAALGDTNGDGLDDVAIGAPGDRVDADPTAGRVLVYRGSSASLLEATPSVLLGAPGHVGLGETITIADVDGVAPFDVIGGGAAHNANGSVDLFSLDRTGARWVGRRTDTSGLWFSKRGLSER
ncbi:MAG: VCBS repeat-containing protein [Myxococcales bacterium]|nr:VCBS repeat-containing protein [Myxococcales bacterium]